MNRRRVVIAALIVILAIVIALGQRDRDPTADDADPASTEPGLDREPVADSNVTPPPADPVDVDRSDQGDDLGVPPRSAFAGFTHFPLDFDAAFADPASMPLRTHEGEGPVEMWRMPVTMFFNPPHKTVGARKWYLKHPHAPEDFDFQSGTVIADWHLYLVSDATLTLDRIGVDVDRHGNDIHPSTLADVDEEILAIDEVDGDPVLLGVSIGFQVTEGLSIVYDRLRLRRAIVDEVRAAGGVHRFPAGTHLGYGGSSLWVFDDHVDAAPYPPGANPFDYFTPDLQQRLMALYAPLHDILADEGVHPFTDLAKSDLAWDVPGTLEGSWIREGGRGFHAEGFWWEVLAFVGRDHLSTETYWHVLDHPWNVENDLRGLFLENQTGDEPETPLYDISTVGQPFLESRFYLLEGDLEDGIAMIIARYVTEGARHPWRPLGPDIDAHDNHPSAGARRYLRFTVHADGGGDVLTIQGFTTLDGARAGFTADAQRYRRTPIADD